MAVREPWRDEAAGEIDYYGTRAHMGTHRFRAADRDEFFACDREALSKRGAVASGEDLAVDRDDVGGLPECGAGGGTHNGNDGAGRSPLPHDVLPMTGRSWRQRSAPISTVQIDFTRWTENK